MSNFSCIRKFPYPYKCALAICSDIDAIISVERFLELQKFLCTDKETTAGKGISLEIGNSFLFFRNSDHPGISYFNGLSKVETDFAPVCRELIKSGFIDVLHTYGDFNLGGFNRDYAETSIEELICNNLKLKTWVNHGNKLNSQNVGGLPEFIGDSPGTKSYHLDLLKKYGMKYFWTSQLTHLVGQDSKLTSTNLLKNQLQKVLAIKYYGKQVNPFFSNNLMNKIKQDDGTEINSFMRFINPWGKYSYTDAENFPNQLSLKVLSELKENEGYMILYTHLGNYKNLNKILPDNTIKSLRNLSDEYFGGNVFVTTTTRLLNYYEVIQNLKVEEKDSGNRKTIQLHFDNNFLPDTDDLVGLTFYTELPERTDIFYNDKQIKVIINSADFTGRKSVTIPWKKLQFPYEIL